jgi:hypothetical protein
VGISSPLSSSPHLSRSLPPSSRASDYSHRHFLTFANCSISRTLRSLLLVAATAPSSSAQERVLGLEPRPLLQLLNEADELVGLGRRARRLLLCGRAQEVTREGPRLGSRPRRRKPNDLRHSVFDCPAPEATDTSSCNGADARPLRADEEEEEGLGVARLR